MNKFLYGSATSAYQVEGAYSEADKSMSNWDSYCHSEKNLNKITGDVSCDQYHHYKEDIKMLAESGQNAYRFSLSWTRILPGNGQVVSKAGVNYYKKIIRECQKYSIEPFVTLYHYDLPIELFNQGGWENRETAYSFVKYAQVCFREFGENVKYWTTINEPNY